MSTTTKLSTNESNGISTTVLDVLETKTSNRGSGSIHIERKSQSVKSSFVERQLVPGNARCVVKTPPVTFSLASTRTLEPRPQISSSNPKQVITTMLERLVFEEINDVRRDPPAYAKKLQLRLSCDVVGSTLWSKDVGLRLTEGKAVLEEVIALLSGMAPVPLLEGGLSDGLCLAALDLTRDLGPKGLMGQVGTDETTLRDRVDRYGVWIDGCVEVLSYSAYEPSEIVCQLLLDDGVPSRWHRNALLDGRMREAGVCMADHAASNVMTVITLCGRFVPNSRENMILAHDANNYAMPTPDGRCTHCFAKVDERKCVYGNSGKQYHRHCFLCKVCKSTLREGFYVFDGHPYCPDCLVFRHQPSCAKCKTKIANSTEQYKVDDKLVCEDCFLDVAVMLQAGYKHNKEVPEKKE